MQGTIGGNLAMAAAHTDPGTAALVYGGTVTLAGPNGRREVDLASLWSAPRHPAEIIVAILLRTLDSEWVVAHDRVEVLHRPPTGVASVAARVDGGRITGCRIAVGAAVDRPQRLDGVEAGLVGCDVRDVTAAVEEYATDACARLPAVSDRLGSAEFKRRLLIGLVQRAVGRALEAEVSG
jgi:carbon-monoxide dehydrogenase medium subunit